MSSTSNGGNGGDAGNHVIPKRRIQELIKEISPNERIDPDVEDILLEVADDFVDSVTQFSCQLAKHRKSDTLEAKDVSLHLERNWNIKVPGFTTEDLKQIRKPAVVEAHKQRIAAVQKAKATTTTTATTMDTTAAT